MKGDGLRLEKRGCPDAGSGTRRDREVTQKVALLGVRCHACCAPVRGAVLAHTPVLSCGPFSSSLMSPCHLASHGSDPRNPRLSAYGCDVFWSPSGGAGQTPCAGGHSCGA